MLTYYQQYNIAHGIYITFSNRSKKRLLHSSHKRTTMDKYIYQFPYKKFETRTKEYFVLSCLYTIDTYAPASFHGFLSSLGEVKPTNIKKFKQDILNYETYIKQDINYLIEKYDVPTYKQAISEYTNRKIKFYTAWYYITLDKNAQKIKNELKSSRVYSFLYYKLRFLMMFVTFNEEAINNIKYIYDQLKI